MCLVCLFQWALYFSFWPMIGTAVDANKKWLLPGDLADLKFVDCEEYDGVGRWCYSREFNLTQPMRDILQYCLDMALNGRKLQLEQACSAKCAWNFYHPHFKDASRQVGYQSLMFGLCYSVVTFLKTDGALERRLHCKRDIVRRRHEAL